MGNSISLDCPRCNEKISYYKDIDILKCPYCKITISSVACRRMKEFCLRNSSLISKGGDEF